MDLKNAPTGTRLSELEGASDEATRFADVCIAIRRRSTGEDLFSVGGKWDRVERKYVGKADRKHVILINESQLELAEALKSWLGKRIRGEDREIIQFAGVKRGGGKTHWFVIAMAVVGVALPGAVIWNVNPTHSRRDEVERIFRAQIPRRLGWWFWRGQPDYRFTWLTGSVIRLLSGEMPESVKQGGAEVLFINEAQDQERKVFSLGLPAIRNTDERPAGLLCIAANPPQRVKGEWVIEVVERLKDGRIDGKYFDVDPKMNVSVEQRALDKIETAVMEVDPQAARADIGGQWLPVGERAYPMWRSRPKKIEGMELPALVGEVPELGFKDVTSELLQTVGIYRTSNRTYSDVLAADFQGRPHMAALAGRLYKRPDGKLVYCINQEFIARGDELDLSDEIQSSGIYTPDTAIIVGDASGAWQSGKDRKRSIASYLALGNERWRVIAPTDKKRTESEYAANPPVDRSLSQMYVVMRESRILVHPRCIWLIEALEKCPLKRDGARPVIPAKGGFSHITDCLRYFVARFEEKSSSAPPVGKIPVVKVNRPTGIRTL